MPLDQQDGKSLILLADRFRPQLVRPYHRLTPGPQPREHS